MALAYRTNDARHLLNVPAAKMSAWPEDPEDFLNFARRQNAATGPGEFLPRRTYGEYVRATFQAAAQSADPGLSVEMIRDEATGLRSEEAAGGWTVTTAGGREVSAQTAIIALGHRPPAEQFIRRWQGPRTWFVADPWAALVLSQIGPDESVLVLGSGLTAVDALLTLDRADRTAPITVVSRHGLLPQSHAPVPPANMAALVAAWLAAAPLKVRDLVHSFRQVVAVAAGQGVDWRSELDGLRPFITKIWRSSHEERSRFLRHVRPFWEIHRHRMAPAVAAVGGAASRPEGARFDGRGVDKRGRRCRRRGYLPERSWSRRDSPVAGALGHQLHRPGHPSPAFHASVAPAID